MFEAVDIKSGSLFSRALFQAGPTGEFWVRADNVTDPEIWLMKNQTMGPVFSVAGVSRSLTGAELRSCGAAQSVKELDS